MSIVTGEGSAHPKFQERKDFSRGDLKVCAAGIGDGVRQSIGGHVVTGCGDTSERFGA